MELIPSPYKALTENHTPFQEIAAHSLKMGVTSFGGPVAHIGLFTNYLVNQKKIISESKFLSFLTICNILPGPTSSQLITTIFLWKSNSIKGGMISFFCFNLPGLIIILILAAFLKDSQINYDSNKVVKSIIYGIWQAAVALVFQAGVNLTKKLISSRFQLLLILTSFVTYTCFPHYYVMIILMAICGTISFLKNEDGLAMKFETEKNFTEITFLGLPSLIVWASIYLLLTLLTIFTDSWTISIFERFYRIGSLIIGGGHVVIPMLLSEFSSLSQSEIYNAFSIVSLLPGPMFNMAGYIGTAMGGVIIGFLSAVFLFLPGFLLLFGGLGFLDRINNERKMQTFLKGIGSASIGFIFSAFGILWWKSCFAERKLVEVVMNSLNVVICFFLIEKRKMNIVLVNIIAVSFSLITNMVL